MRKEQVLVLVLLALPIAAVSFSATAVAPRIFSGAGQMRALHREGLNEISGFRIKCKTGKCPRRVAVRWMSQMQKPEDNAPPAITSDLLSDTSTIRTAGAGKAEEGGDIERMLLQGVGVSGVFMFLWVFVLFPGSAYTGFAAHDAFIQFLFEKVPLFGIVAPVSLITKYNELGHIPAFTHAVPGAIWSIIAPLQLFPEARARLGRLGHKRSGQMMLLAASLLMTGYAIIDANDLYSDTHDFAGNGGGLARWIDERRLLPLPVNLIGVRMLAAYFAGTQFTCFTGTKAQILTLQASSLGFSGLAVCRERRVCAT